MDDLITFLRARLDEDEQTARAAHAPNWSTDGRRGLHYGVEDGWMADALTTGDADHIARHDPARVLREVEAKRMIVERFADLSGEDWKPSAPRVVRLQELRDSVRCLAVAYADHPDYRDDWRP
ncbi:DUF6221 family protein [Streptomyces sp. NPDC004658]|uniref:DUF6221 family protein n=1 Tax=unclassified Streptomyces TaxID=2593676 RepID=UPI0033A87E86